MTTDMSAEIWIIAEFTPKEGKNDEFKEVANLFITTVQANEPGTLTYQFYFNKLQTKCLVLAQFRDSKAVLAHFKDVGGLVLKLIETAQLTRGELYGNVSTELRLVATPFGVNFFKPWGGFSRGS